MLNRIGIGSRFDDHGRLRCCWRGFATPDAMRSGCGWVIASEALITRRRQMRSAREAVRAGAELHLPMDASYGFLFRELYRGDVDVCTYPTYTLEEKGKGAISKGLKRSLLSLRVSSSILLFCLVSAFFLAVAYQWDVCKCSTDLSDKRK
ncbi:hypothetical protein BHE74_00054342 [Ensete ventricosum]|nr:hypothetical protein GW17_00004428 [Ensete ventricosum]RWW40261.1 hypothetical protein BHE74_00054342 [Ensete ventricosum]RZR89964.1 hypothetical protein BHM03_00017781 [Ensete ventricosum]